MAEIETKAAPKRDRGAMRKLKKSSTRVDLTPMVDLGFLLITFFILTTTWSRPKTTRLRLPAPGDPTNISDKAVLTLIAGKDNKVFYYAGSLQEALQQGAYGTRGYSQHNGIGDIIRQQQILMDHTVKGGRKELMILIKPSGYANLQNIVSLLDETIINVVPKYALVELNKEEQRVLVDRKLF